MIEQIGFEPGEESQAVAFWSDYHNWQQFQKPRVLHLCKWTPGASLKQILLRLWVQESEFADQLRLSIASHIADSLTFFQRNPLGWQVQLAGEPEYIYKAVESFLYFQQRCGIDCSPASEGKLMRALESLGTFLNANAQGFLFDSNPSNMILDLQKIADSLGDQLPDYVHESLARRFDAADGGRKQAQEEEETLLRLIGDACRPDTSDELHSGLLEAIPSSIVFIDLGTIWKHRVAAEDVILFVESPLLSLTAEEVEKIESRFLIELCESQNKDVYAAERASLDAIRLFRHVRSAHHLIEVEREIPKRMWKGIVLEHLLRALSSLPGARRPFADDIRLWSDSEYQEVLAMLIGATNAVVRSDFARVQSIRDSRT